jgi:YggT family protein
VTTLANFIAALGYVYTLMIIAYIVMSMLPLPYNRTLITIRDFLDQTVSPFLNVFRRFIPPLGPIDISPMIAIIALNVVTKVLIGIVLG